MFAKLNKIGELTKILSVKSETCDSIMHFMSVFWHRKNPFQTFFGQDAGSGHGGTDSGHDGFPYSW
jgi:hypothetical protein